MSNEVNNSENKNTNMLFIPNGADITDYTVFKVKMFRSIRKNEAMLRETVFGRMLEPVKGAGLKVNAPWVKTKLVLLASKNIDYPKAVYKTQDGIEVTADLALTVQIVDPALFEYAGINILEELNVLTKDIMRIFIAKHDVDNLISHRYTISDFDPQRRYANFASKYGIACTNVYFKNIDIPQSLKDDYEKKKEQEEENKRRLMDAENRRAVAQIDAEVIELKAKAEANANAIKISKFIDALTEKGQLDEYLAEVLKTRLLSEGNAQVIANLGNSEMGNLQASILAAVNQRNNSNFQNNGNKSKNRK